MQIAGGCLGALFAGIVVLVIVISSLISAVISGLGPLAGHIAGNTLAAPSASALSDIPTNYLTLYEEAAATCPGLPWTVLAAIGRIETNHGRDPSMVSSAGAEGPMQFMPATWTQYGGGGNIWNPTDAIFAAARYLCANGASGGHDIPGAVYDYNHATWYVTEVLTQAAAYTAPAVPSATAPNPAAATAIDYARAQIGTPYLWGGNGPAAGDAGFDCSGLTQAAYAAAGIALPRVAQDQYAATPHVPPGTPLQPGDLVFYGTATNIHHVGIYIGNGQMIDAPHTGALVRIEPYLDQPDYYGASRPA